MLGFASGSMIFQKIWNGPAPSIRAASSSSVGRFRNAVRMRNVPNALNRPGATMPRVVFNQPKPCTIWYCEMRYACDGTMRIESVTASRIVRPRNRMRANAYPAMVQRTICAIVRMTVMRIEVRSWSRNGSRSNTAA